MATTQTTQTTPVTRARQDLEAAQASLQAAQEQAHAVALRSRDIGYLYQCALLPQAEVVAAETAAGQARAAFYAARGAWERAQEAYDMARTADQERRRAWVLARDPALAAMVAEVEAMETHERARQQAVAQGITPPDAPVPTWRYDLRRASIRRALQLAMSHVPELPL